MCGRYLRKLLREDAIKHFDLEDGIDYFDIHGYKTDAAEVFPGEWIFAINNQNRPEDIWWTIEDRDSSGTVRRTINAKAETVAKVPMFRDAFWQDRVLIPATGFFEWAPDKQKYLFTFDEPIFAFAGIARDCQIKDEQKRCGVILTTEANDIVRPIHTKNRMPVVIHKYDYRRWLNPDTPFEELRQMMLPLSNEETHTEKFTDPPKLANEPSGGNASVNERASSATVKDDPAPQASLFDM